MPDARPEAKLEVRNISVGYDGLEVVHDLSFDVGAGEIVALVGSNGAGKSTALKAVSGLLKPARGEILWNGRRIDGMAPHKIAALGVAHVPEGKQLFTRLTVEDNLDLGAYLNKDPAFRAKVKKRIYGLFPVLFDRRQQITGTLSGGEQQMLAMGRALMLDPKLLMLDEPSLGIAPKLVLDIFRAIEEINSEGLPVLLLEQRLEQTLKLAERAYVIQTGRVVKIGRGSELLNSPEVRAAYLGIAAV